MQHDNEDAVYDQIAEITWPAVIVGSGLGVSFLATLFLEHAMAITLGLFVALTLFLVRASRKRVATVVPPRRVGT